MFDELANELKSAREKSLMSLAQLSNKSKIDIKFLEAMEHGDFSFLPELYTKAFVKNYARIVGLDENKIGKKYEAAKQGIPYIEEEPVKKEIKTVQQVPTVSAPKEKLQIQKERTEVKRIDTSLTFDAVSSGNPAQDTSSAIKKRNLILGGSAIGVFILFSLIYFLFIHKGDQEIIVEKPIEEVIEQSQRYVENEQGDLQNNFEGADVDNLALTISTTDTTWIKIVIDEKSNDEFILLPNSKKTLSARSNYKVTFGNPAGIALQLNKTPLSFSPKNGGAKTVIINRDGLKYTNNSSSQR